MGHKKVLFDENYCHLSPIVLILSKKKDYPSASPLFGKKLEQQKMDFFAKESRTVS
jgi:hypothetical protein